MSASAAVGFGLAMLSLVAGGALGIANIRRVSDHSRDVAHTHAVLEHLELLLSTLKDAETGQRGYLLTGDASYLKPYDEAVTRVHGIQARLRELTSDSVEQQARIDALGPNIADKLAELSETIALAERGDREAAIQIVRSDVGKERMDVLRRHVLGVRQAEETFLLQRTREADASLRAAVLTVALTATFGIVLVAGVIWMLHRGAAQRLRAAAALAEQGERLQTTLASIGDAVMTTDTEGRVTHVNRVAESLTGWTHAEAAGRPLPEVFRIVNETTREGVENPAMVALRDGTVVGLANHTRLISRDGTERPIDDSAAPIRTADGPVIGCVLVFRDITERKRLEDDLRRVADELSEAARRKDEFLATLAHELRNPLAPLRSGLRVMRMTRNDAESIEQSRSMMERQLSHMVRLIDDLLDVSRISRGKLELRKERVQLAAIVRSAVETSGPVIEEMHHELTVTLPSEPVVLDGDPTRLAQVLSNILSNAAKYTDPGGRIRLSSERRADTEVVISIRDNGVGIPPHELPTIFDMFSQADRSLERTRGGLGIGLSLAKRLVEMHGGSLSAVSEGPGRGTELIVSLPVAGGVEGAPESGKREQPQPRGPLRILIVDDNRDAADSLGMMLELSGYSIRTAYDGQEGLSAADEERPDVVLLDIGLPKLNGYEVCRRIRQRPWGNEVTLVAVTGWGQDQDLRRAEGAGFDRHMVKPVDPDDLMKLLATLTPLRRSA
jgi:two-component system CheB/CheR fusion protein